MYGGNLIFLSVSTRGQYHFVFPRLQPRRHLDFCTNQNFMSSKFVFKFSSFINCLSCYRNYHYFTTAPWTILKNTATPINTQLLNMLSANKAQ